MGQHPADPGVVPAAPLAAGGSHLRSLRAGNKPCPSSVSAAGLSAGLRGHLPHAPALCPAGVGLCVTQMLCSQSTTGNVCLRRPCRYTPTSQSGLFIY